jgi:hypothetical protein
MDSDINKLKLKLHINNSDNKDERLIEVDESISVRALKKNIQSSLNLGKFQILHAGKDLLENNDKTRLCELFTTRDNDVELKVNVIPRKFKSSKMVRKKKRLKYMLACNLHNRENAHYFCFKCKLSFCTLCLSDHHKGHDYIDKYEYSKSSEELVNGIMEAFITDLKKLDDNKKCNIFSHLLEGEGLSETMNCDIVTQYLEELKLVYSEYSTFYQRFLRNKSYQKIEDFKENLLKYKSICLSSIAGSKSFNKTEIILEEDYFLELHKTINELNLGKDALVKYMDMLNKRFDEEKGQYTEFSNEIALDLMSLINKIKNKMSTMDSGYVNSPEKNFENLVFDDLCITERELTERDNEEEIQMQSKLISETDLSTSMSVLEDRYIMKRRLSKDPDIILYDSVKKSFQIKKIKSIDKNFKNFLEFSVYINVDNLLYISGGKTKKGVNSNDFYSFNALTNELNRLPNMLKERCSHSMVATTSHIYAIGGYSNNTTERYCLKTNIWTRLPDLNYRERQVPTLFLYNNFIVCIFGYINNVDMNENYYERLNTDDCAKWEMILLNSNLNRLDTKIFNVGVISISSNQFLICGGEQYKGEETDNVYLLDMENSSISAYSLKMPGKCSFIDKNFIKYSSDRCAQYEMKRNNLIIFDIEKCKFSIKSF